MIQMWQSENVVEQWDEMLSGMGGHPLQSRAWGMARLHTSGIRQLFLKYQLHEGSLLGLARVEIRKAPFLGNVAWIPRGPVVRPEANRVVVREALEQKLKDDGFLVSALQPWEECAKQFMTNESARPSPRTIWIDLTVGKVQLQMKLDKQWRYGVGRAAREGVVIERTTDPNDVAEFFQLCVQISQTKGFALPGSQSLIQTLLDQSSSDSPVEACLFVARHQGRLGAGAVVMRSGRNVHYLWGGVERELSRYRTGEAVQWGVIEWALERGCDLYDLEGIDPVNNPGTYSFKKKMGGREVTLPVLSTRSLRVRGVPLKFFLDRRNQAT